MSALRVQDVTASTITYYTVSDSANVSMDSLVWTGGLIANAQTYGGHQYSTGAYTSGIGPVNVVTPGDSTSAAVLQAALQALSSIGSGGVNVLDPGQGSSPGRMGYTQGIYGVTFSGSLAGAPQPMMTTTYDSVSIAEITAGGNAPTLSINGGDPIILGNWIWSEPSPGLPYALSPLLQSAPATQTNIVNMLPWSQSDFWNGTYIDDGSLSGGPIFGWNSGLTMSFTYPELPPGTYQFAAIYPNTSFTQNGITYQPSTTTQFLIQDGNGTTLAGPYTVDQTQPATPESPHVLGSVTLATRGTLACTMTTVGQSAAIGEANQIVAILDAIRINRTSEDLSVVIGPDDTVTLDIPANWMTTALGLVPATTNLSVSPPSPTAIMPAFVANPKTMKVGYNVEPVTYFSDMITHSNLAYLLGTMGSVQDANGYPTRFVAPSYAPGQLTCPIILNNGTQPADQPQGAYMVNPGLFVMTWDGDAAITIYQGGEPGTTITEITNDQVLTGTTGNRRVFNVQFDPVQIAHPILHLFLNSETQDLELDPTGFTYVINLTNLKIYPPDPSDPTGMTIWVDPPKFYPWYLYKLQGMQTFRTMDVMNTNQNPASLFAHYKPETHANRTSVTFVNKTVGVSLIKQAPSDVLYFTGYTGPVVQVTTTAPHGLYNGGSVSFVDCGTAEFANSQTLNMAQTYALIHVLDDTNLICVLANDGIPFPTAMTNTLTGGSIITTEFGTFWSLQDVVDLVAAVPTITDLHFNMPVTIDVTPGPGGGAYDVAAFLAANLKHGVKVHFEFGNECWNEGFDTWFWCALQTARLTNETFSGAYTTFFTAQTKLVHEQCLAAFTAAGRPGDMVHLYGVFTGQPAVTADILAKTLASGATVDELCVALYFNSWPIFGYATDQLPIFNAMTVDQLLDYMELNAVYGQYPENFVANQYSVLTENGNTTTKVIAYEGSPDTLIPIDPVGAQAPANTPNFFIRQQTMRRHPRMYGVILQMAQGFQDAGLTMWNWFQIGGNGSVHCWDCYESGNQQRGTGTSADTINLTNPLAKNLALNEEGGALHFWSTLSAPSGTTTNKQATEGRNGKIKAIGLPRGMNRLVGSH